MLKALINDLLCSITIKTFRALALNCNAKIDSNKGAIATDWKKGKPVRVVRNYKLQKHSKYAPEAGNRYARLF